MNALSSIVDNSAFSDGIKTNTFESRSSFLQNLSINSTIFSQDIKLAKIAELDSDYGNVESTLTEFQVKQQQQQMSDEFNLSISTIGTANICSTCQTRNSTHQYQCLHSSCQENFECEVADINFSAIRQNCISFDVKVASTPKTSTRRLIQTSERKNLCGESCCMNMKETRNERRKRPTRNGVEARNRRSQPLHKVAVVKSKENKLKLRRLELVLKKEDEQKQRKPAHAENLSCGDLLSCNEQLKNFLKLNQKKSNLIVKIQSNLTKNWKNFLSKNAKINPNSAKISNEEMVKTNQANQQIKFQKETFDIQQQNIFNNNNNELLSNSYYQSTLLNQFNQFGQFQVWYV